MKLLEIAQRIDKSPANEDWINTEEIGEELGLYNMDYYNQDRLKAYWIGNWRCTDTSVGYRMYFLDNEPVGFSLQQGRKCDKEYRWFSQESAKKVKDYLISLLSEDDKQSDIIICDINEEIDEGLTLHFNNEIISCENVTLNGEKVEFVNKVKESPYGIDSKVIIRTKEGIEKQVEINELRFGYNLL